MELSLLASLKRVDQNYNFLNTICCFGCREFCREQHLLLNTDWLIRRYSYYLKFNKEFLSRLFRNKKKYLQGLLKANHYSYYHRHRRRRFCFDCISSPKSIASDKKKSFSLSTKTKANAHRYSRNHWNKYLYSF